MKILVLFIPIGFFFLGSAFLDFLIYKYDLCVLNLLISVLCFELSIIGYRYGRRSDARTGFTETKRSNR